MASIFSKIIAGEIPCYKIAEDEFSFAFLDINPLVKGHTLVVPKLEVDYLYDLDDLRLKELWCFSKIIAKAVEKVILCKRIGVAVIGLEVPHAHIHLIPLNSLYDIDFKQPKLVLESRELESIACRIREAI